MYGNQEVYTHTYTITFLPSGHRTYVGYMYLEYTRNNAVLRTFVQLLVDQVKGRHRAKKGGVADYDHGIQRNDSISSVSSSDGM